MTPNFKDYGRHLKLEAYANMGSTFKDDLVEEIARLRKAGDYSQSGMERSNVSKIIKVHTGIKTTFIVNDFGRNAAARLGPIDANHPFFAMRDMPAWFWDDISVNKLADNNNGPLSGTVDRKRYKVSGVFSEIETVMFMGHQLISDTHYTDGEIAEIIMHEVGHLFTYFEYTGQVIRDSYVISHASRSVISNEDPEVRKKVLVRARDQLGITELNYETLVNEATLTRKDTTEMVLISRTLFRGPVHTTTPLYDWRSIEQIADAFVVYHGGGRDVASALNKLRKSYGDIATRDPITYIVIELMKVTWFFIVLLLGGPVLTLLFTISMLPPAGKWYDDPKDRVVGLRNHMVNAMRQSKSKEEKQNISEQIDALNQIIVELNDRKSFFTLIYRNLSPVGRKLYNEEKHHREINQLVFNELQAKAFKLRERAK